MRRIAPLWIELNKEQGERAYRAAVKRGKDARARAAEHKAGYVGDSLAIDIPGCQGELAWHERLGLEWNENQWFKLPDWSWYAQIRCARCQATRPPPGFGTLIVRPKPDDDPRDCFTLVAGHFPYFVLLGWIEGEKAQRPEWLKPEGGRAPAWFVPNKVLNKDLDALLERG